MAAACPISQAVLLVGGAGTRLRPLTYLMPKALLPVLNRPLISYELELLGRSGVPDVLLTTGYQASQLRDVLGGGESWSINLIYVEEQRPLDTAGAIKNAQELLGGDFFAF
ncbi:MAG: NTP transferase domain-containing protein, partial [Armatimonadetes bacterium]|nr:NTP transferase domain-containing protein [Armatimonadota bacterium]